MRRDRVLTAEINTIQQEVRQVCGSPRMTRELARHGHRVGHNHVARLMRDGDLGARPKKRIRVTTRSRKGDQVAQNVLDRRFQVASPDRVWVSDITYVATSEDWLYVCVALDLYARRVVGWSTGSSLGTELALQAFIDSLHAAAAAANLAVPLRSRRAIHQLRVLPGSGAPWHPPKHEPQG